MITEIVSVSFIKSLQWLIWLAARQLTVHLHSSKMKTCILPWPVWRYMLSRTRSQWWGSRHSSHNTGRPQCLFFVHPLLRLLSYLPLNSASKKNPSPQPLPHPLNVKGLKTFTQANRQVYTNITVFHTDYLAHVPCSWDTVAAEQGQWNTSSILQSRCPCLSSSRGFQICFSRLLGHMPWNVTIAYSRG